MWKLRQVLEYITFYLGAQTPARMHSPFLYDLLVHVFDDQKEYYSFGEIEHIRAQLLASDDRIDVRDFGAGSRAGTTKASTISEVTGRASSSPRKCALLFRLVEMLQPEVTVELGSSVGLSLAYLAAACSTSEVHGFEGDPTLANVAEDIAKSLKLNNVSLHVGLFEETLEHALKKIGPVDLVYLDGDHREDATVTNYYKLREHMTKDSVMIVDDIRWSPGMFNAWQRIIQDDAIRVSIDAFQMAILFYSPRFLDRMDLRITPNRLDGGPILR